MKSLAGCCWTHLNVCRFWGRRPFRVVFGLLAVWISKLGDACQATRACASHAVGYSSNAETSAEQSWRFRGARGILTISPSSPNSPTISQFAMTCGCHGWSGAVPLPAPWKPSGNQACGRHPDFAGRPRFAIMRR
jgi:hypothetical protein